MVREKTKLLFVLNEVMGGLVLTDQRGHRVVAPAERGLDLTV